MSDVNPRKERSRPLTLCCWGAMFCALAWFGYQLWPLWMPDEAFYGIGSLAYDFATFLVVVTGGLVIWRDKPLGLKISVRNILAIMLLIAFWLGAGQLYEQRAPLRLAFRYSRSALDTIADRVAKGGAAQPMPINETAGCFPIATAQTVGRAVILRVRTGILPGSYGFIRIPGQTDNEIDGAAYGLPSVVDRVLFLRISGDWFVFFDLYRNFKTGWS